MCLLTTTNTDIQVKRKFDGIPGNVCGSRCRGLFFYIMEIWKDITGYAGLYQISNLGRVKRNNKILI